MLPPMTTLTEEAAVARLAAAMTRLQSATAMRRFLDEIFTPAELHDLSLRWRLLEQLRDGVPQRTIARDLHISLCKITRGARVLRDPQALTAGLLHACAQGDGECSS